MASLNILQGSIRGSIGEVTGSVWKGKPTIRAKVFSKAPHKEIQTASVRAFEKLNRLSSAIAQAGFTSLGLSAKDIHKHNAVARWLKPTVKNHVFEPANISEVIPSGNDIRITRFFHDNYTKETFLDIRMVQSFTPPTGSYLFAIVFDDNGTVYFSHCGTLENLSSSFFIDSFGKQVLSVIAFYTTPIRNKLVARNFLYKRGNIMRYSLTEQSTGDLWLDGKPIYQHTFISHTEVVHPKGTSSSSIYVKDIERLTDYKLFFKTPGQYPSCYYSSPALFDYNATRNNVYSISVVHSYDTEDVEINFTSDVVQQYTNFDNSEFTITFWYTKKSDLPVVDG